MSTSEESKNSASADASSGRGLSAEGESQQIMLILVGLIGSGKSTFAQDLEYVLPHFRRCSQDELGNRRACEVMARAALRDGLSVCVDRTNIDSIQRSHWIRIAREFAVPVGIIFFDTPYGICAQRLRSRRDHPTIKDVETGLQILSRFASEFVSPEPREGYHQLLRLPPDEQSISYSREEVLNVMQRLRTAQLSRTTEQTRTTTYFHSGGRGLPTSYRGNTYGQRGNSRPRGAYSGNYTSPGAGPHHWRDGRPQTHGITPHEDQQYHAARGPRGSWRRTPARNDGRQESSTSQATAGMGSWRNSGSVRGSAPFEEQTNV